MGGFKIFAHVLVGIAVVLGFMAIILVFSFYWFVLQKEVQRRDAEERENRERNSETLPLRLVIRRVMFKFVRNCGMRNIIILLLISLMLAYLFSYKTGGLALSWDFV